MSQFDVLKENSLLGFGQERTHLDKVLRHLQVKLRLEAGHFREGPGHGGIIERAGSRQNGGKFLSPGVNRGLTRDEARVVGHRDFVNLLLLLGREVQDIEGIV
jgi:hypothetical protein